MTLNFGLLLDGTGAGFSHGSRRSQLRFNGKDHFMNCSITLSCDDTQIFQQGL